MGWNFKRDDGKMMSEINITPLTDVMLVLLVIFMVTTPLIMAESFKIKLPKAVSADAEPGKGLTVAISETGRININGKDVAKDELYGVFKREFSSGGKDKSVVIRADGSAKHASVVDVLDAAKSAGAIKLSIATERKKN